MSSPKQQYFAKRAEVIVKNLQSRHFGACYCATKEEALEKALQLSPEGSKVGWGGAMSAQEIGLLQALENGNWDAVGRNTAGGVEVFVTGANALSIDGEMVNIDGFGNRVSAIIYGPKTVVVIAGMNKVMDSLEDAISRARTVAAPVNMQRFDKGTPCAVTGICHDCKHEDCICNHIVITRHGRPNGRIQFVLVGEDLGF